VALALVVLGGGAAALQQVAAPAAPPAAVSDVKLSGFRFEIEATVPGTPEQVFDATTGDVTGWWDHSFSGHPYRMFIEPKPGGGFYEYFDKDGNGVRHAEVTWAERGKRLTFVGPLPLNGAPVEIGCTLEYASVDESHTSVRVTVQGGGALPDKAGEQTADVWRHFLMERLVPYMEAGGKASGTGAAKEPAR